MQFTHLHCHTQFSLLDGAADIGRYFKKAKADNMPAVAITDHGNMFGVFDFVATAGKHGIKPIVGCEFYVVEDRFRKSFPRGTKDVRNHQLFLAKNPEGYRNLVKMCSLGFIEGLHGKYPRIDKSLIEKYHTGLIATTCCIGAMVPQAILKGDLEAAEREFQWWLNLFGEDYYIELQRHAMAEQDKVNQVLLKWSEKYNVKTIATNDSHYVDREDANAHDILLCINTGEKQATPKMKEMAADDEAAGDASAAGGKREKGRFAFPNDEFYFKTTDEMSRLFKDVPQAIDNTNEIVDKIEVLKLKQDILLPNFPIPTEFQLHADDVLNQWEYLKAMTYEGARKRYGEISETTRERLDFELFTIKTMGFAGYFLIVADFIKAGRDLGVFIGPGRGSAAGSAVAYCVGITNIDPIKYNLLFERFLNPDRKSMPDIDTDFDDEGRQKVIDYVVQKYGRAQVAQIVTYGTMAAKMSIKDVARVLDLPLSEANAMAKLVPDKPGISLNRVLKAPIEGEGSLMTKENLVPEDIENCRKLREILAGNDQRSAVLKEALILEGSVRNTGIHAAGIIIAPKDLTEIIPVCVAKDSDLYVTQYEGKIIEDAGVIKMDFLGLRNLTIIKEALRLIKELHGKEIIIDDIPLDDAETYKLYQRGETNGTFQFESTGMQKYLRDLKPDRFDDLIAMNALYRPGPLEYIPNFIRRKHGQEEVVYDLPEMEEYLKETFGISVYQEQIMLLSQKLAGFSKGDADVLRKAMGKKDRATLDKMKGKFIDGATAKGLDPVKLDKVWTDWEAFAAYAFNKSHSTCYAFVAYQTAWLKTHYAAEYMAGLLTSTLGNIEKTTFYMEECKRMGLKVFGPDVNESKKNFNVNKRGEIRFGMGAIKGTGDAAIDAIVEARKDKITGLDVPFADIYDFVTRVSTRTVNKKTMEALAQAGAFDSFSDLHRGQFFYKGTENEENFIERLTRFATKASEEKESASSSLFGGGGNSDATQVVRPKPPICEPWLASEALKKEKEVVGIFISGHPLDRFKWQIDQFTTCNTSNLDEQRGKEVKLAGMINDVRERTTKTGNKFLVFNLEDYNGSTEIALFGEQYANFYPFVRQDDLVFITGNYASRKFDPTAFELRLNKLELLTDELFDKMIRSVSLHIPNSMLTDALLQDLIKLVEQHPGKFPLRFRITDDTLPADISLSSATKVNPAPSLVQELEKLGVVASLG